MSGRVLLREKRVVVADTDWHLEDGGEAILTDLLALARTIDGKSVILEIEVTVIE